MTAVTDAFTDTDGVQLSSHGTGWTKTSTYDPDIQSNGLCPDRNDDQFCYYNAFTPANDQYAQIKIVAVPGSGGDSVGPAVRMSTSGITCYLVYHNLSAWELYKVVAGSYTKVDDASRTLAVNDVLYLEVIGNVLTFKVNGSTVTTYTDSSSPIASGRVGVHAYGDTTSLRADDWEGGDWTTPAAASLVMGNISRRMGHLLGR